METPQPQVSEAATTTKSPWDGQLEILSAVYGLADVTDKITALYNSGQKVIHAENEILGDSWPGVVKSLHITFRYREKPRTVAVKEGSSIVIPDGHEILGASYGTLDVTKGLKEMYAKGQRVFSGTNQVWTDPWVNVVKTFTITYRNEAKTVVVKEHASIALP